MLRNKRVRNSDFAGAARSTNRNIALSKAKHAFFEYQTIRKQLFHFPQGQQANLRDKFGDFGRTRLRQQAPESEMPRNANLKPAGQVLKEGSEQMRLDKKVARGFWRRAEPRRRMPAGVPRSSDVR